MFLMLPASTRLQNRPPKEPKPPQEPPVPTEPKFRRWLSGLRLERWLARFAALGAVAVLVMLVAPRPKLPGVLGSVAAEVHVGMSRDEVANLIRRSYIARQSHDTSRLYTFGMRRDGQPLNSYFDWQLANLPPSEESASGEFDIDDDRYRELIITFGSSGTVTAIRLESDSIWEEVRYSLARGTGWSGWRSLARNRGACLAYTVEHFFSAD